MLLSFKHINKPFLDYSIIKDFGTLQTLFFEVLAKKIESRSHSLIPEFASIPYLNSSLFDRIALEKEGKSIGGLYPSSLTLFSRSILKKDPRFKDKEALPLLEYLFEFLHAYDFTTTPKDISNGVKQNHDKLINSGVLGLVFEKLNGYKEGSFYTPSFITSYMCKESITEATLEKFNSIYSWKCQSLEELREEMGIKGFREHKEEYFQTLLSVKICDPSVGSGHFLVSALNEMIYIAYALKLLPALYESTLELENDEILIKTHDKLHQYTKPSSPAQTSHQIQEELFNLKKAIIENCLFGVDINPNSCEITKLRLWIELLKYSYYLFDEKGKNTNALETLPNIDINIKCGNSLVSRFGLDDNLNKIKNIKQKIQEYKDLVAHYKDPNPLYPLDKTQLTNKILELKILFSLTLKDPKTKSELEKAIRKHIELYNDFALDDESLLEGLNIGAKNLFGTPELSPKEEEEAFASYGRIKALRKKLDCALSGEEYKNAFEWRFEFPEVLDSEGNFLGFDVVIGNPPYIRQEMIKELKPTLAKNYEIYKGTSDIYTYFFERGFKLLTPKGILSFITSNKWTRAGYGEPLRKFILEKTTFKTYIDFNGKQIFESATVDASITSFLKLPPPKGHQVNHLSSNSNLQNPSFDSLPQSSLSKETLTFSSTSMIALKEKIEKIGTPLKDWDININYGIKTGYNEAFIIDTKKREEILNACANEEERARTKDLIKPILRGRDIKRYSYEWAGLWIIGTFPALKLDIDEYPAVKSYLESFMPRIAQSGEKGCRKKTSNKWFETQDQIAYYREFEKEKIIWAEMTKESCFIFDKNSILTNQTCYFFHHQSNKYLLGVLNSKTIFYYMGQIASGLGDGAFRWIKQYVENLPIPKITESNQSIADKIITLVKEILKIKEQDSKSNTQELESQIDLLVYILYNLTDEEIKIIEGEK